MSELQDRLRKLMLRLDRMGMRVEQALGDALQAAENDNVEAGFKVDQNDSLIDREEVEIEQECIRLLALYQPTAIDLRAICTIIKTNSDLERIADLACSIARRVKHVVAGDINLKEDSFFQRLKQDTLKILGLTVRMLNSQHSDTAKRVIELDDQVDEDYWLFVRNVLDAESNKPGGVERAMTQINMAKALERIGDHCTNIAEDIIFLRTGDFVRHPKAFGQTDKQQDKDEQQA